MMKSKVFMQISKINKYYRPAIIRTYSDDHPKQPNPIQRALRILGNDMRTIKNYIAPIFRIIKNTISADTRKPPPDRVANPLVESEFQTHCDILVVGGRAIGASIAYWLKMKARQGLNVVVLEKDNSPLDNRGSLSLPVGGLHQQFFLPENVEMSLYGAEFVMKAKEDLGIDLNFDPQGFLTLASEKNADVLKTMSQMQNELGARTELLTPDRLRVKFPWLNVEDVALGCHGLEKQGWFDSNNFLLGLRFSAKEYGAHFIKAELTDFEFQNLSDVIVEGDNTSNPYNSLDKAVVKMPDGELRTIKFAICIIAAERSSASVARLAKIGTGNGLLRIPLPIQQRKLYGYTFNPNLEPALGLGVPCVVDFNGTHFRRDGLTGNYITAFSTPAESDGDTITKDDDFENVILPSLMHRMKLEKTPQIIGSWESSYDYNAFDENGFIGPHPYYNNLYIATGFTGLGVQQSPAVGRAISELIIDGRFRTIDLTRLGFDRLVVNQPTAEYAFM